MGRSSGGTTQEGMDGMKEKDGMELRDDCILDEDVIAKVEEGGVDEEKGIFIKRTISLDFQLTDIQQLQKTIRYINAGY